MPLMRLPRFAVAAVAVRWRRCIGNITVSAFVQPAMRVCSRGVCVRAVEDLLDYRPVTDRYAVNVKALDPVYAVAQADGVLG